MNPLNNKKLLLAAIDDYSLYTKKQKGLLKYLVNLSIDGEVQFSTKEAAEYIKSSRAVIYLTLDKFQNEGLLKKKEEQRKRISTYTLNNDKLNYIIQFYYNKRDNE